VSDASGKEAAPRRLRGEERRLKEALKRLLKQRGLTYADLAARLELSVPTVARLMTTERLTIERVLAICDVLEIRFTTLVAQIGEPDADELMSELTEDQEELLARVPQLMTYLRLLGRGLSPSDIAAEAQLSERSTATYLRELDIAGLIRRSGTRVRLACRWPPRFRFPGPLQSRYFRASTHTLCDHLTARTLAKEPGYGSDYFIFVNSIGLKPRHYAMFVKDAQELSHKYQPLGELDRQSTPWTKLVQAAGLFAVDRVDLLTKVMGPVREWTGR
jgi:transcriptional regulator with XRE-family HTH domain